MRTLRTAAATTAGQHVKLCGVIKADAYGHGAAGVADLLTNFYTPDLPAPAADVLAVATLEEALALPDLDVPVMVLRPAECVYLGDNRHALEAGLRRNVVVSVISAAGAEDVGRLAETLGLRASVQVMLDTGMHREMCPPEDFADVVAAVRRHAALQLVGVGTHFTDGELEDEPFSDEQLRHFHDAIDPIVESLPATIWKHAANSGGTFFTDDDELNMVRPGLAMYGIDPTCGTYAG
ncbi:MAG: alanine racemase, partial [Planctomycetota bacterium]